jgi:cellulose synthase/poly-beta-1,6-N-acetylglucosamine synthase-like glycosyltransferase
MLILADFSVRKKVFNSLGSGFREDLYPNEENELITRLNQKGFEVFYVPGLQAERTLRNTLPSFVRMCLRNGRGRADCFFVNAATLRGVYLVPAFFVIYLFSLFWLRQSAFWPPLFIYLALDIVFSVQIAMGTGRLPAFFISLASFPCMHISYGIGLLSGLFKHPAGKFLKKSFSSGRGEIRIIRL